MFFQGKQTKPRDAYDQALEFTISDAFIHIHQKARFMTSCHALPPHATSKVLLDDQHRWPNNNDENCSRSKAKRLLAVPHDWISASRISSTAPLCVLFDSSLVVFFDSLSCCVLFVSLSEGAAQHSHCRFRTSIIAAWIFGFGPLCIKWFFSSLHIANARHPSDTTRSEVEGNMTRSKNGIKSRITSDFRKVTFEKWLLLSQ